MNNISSSQAEASSQRVWQLAWPTILSNLLYATVGFVHIKIASGFGTSSVAAVTTGHRVFFLMQAVMMGLSVAVTAIVSQSWGARNYEDAARDCSTAIQISIVIGALFSLPAILLPNQIANLFGLDSLSVSIASDFIYWLGIFGVPSAISLILSAAMRATGDVITPLIFLIASSLMNTLLAISLAHGIGPFPRLEVEGIALGGGLASTIIMIFFLTFWWRGHFTIKAEKKIKIAWSRINQIVVLASPAILEQFIIHLSFLLFFALIAEFGTEAYAAYGIGISIVSFPIVIGFGFGIAAATLVGQQLGAGKNHLAIKAGWRSMRLALGAMTLGSLLITWQAHNMASFMAEDQEVIHLTKVFFYIIAIAMPFMACEVSLAGALRGAGDVRYPMITTLCGLLIARLIPAWIFTNLGLSVYWILLVMLTDYMLKAAMVIYRFRSNIWMEKVIVDRGNLGDKDEQTREPQYDSSER